MKNSSGDLDSFVGTNQVVGEFRENLLKTVTAKPGPRNFPHLSLEKLEVIKIIKRERPLAEDDETENYPVTTPAPCSPDDHHDDENYQDDDDFDVDDPDYNPDAEENLVLSSEKVKESRQIKSNAKVQDEVRADSIKTYSCHFCGKMFGLIAVLRFHQKKVHRKETSIPLEEVVSSGKTKLKCPSCPKTFTVRKNALHHYRMRHVNIPGEAKKPFKCDICGLSFGRRDNLKDHGKIRHSYKCQFCKFSFTTQVKLTIHLRDHVKSKTENVATSRTRTKIKVSKSKNATASRILENSEVAQKINIKTDNDAEMEHDHDHDPLEDFSESRVSLVKSEIK